MNRSRKTKILSQVFTGELTLLQVHKNALDAQRRRPTQADLEAMSDAQLIAFIEENSQELVPDYSAMSDEEIGQRIAELEAKIAESE